MPKVHLYYKGPIKIILGLPTISISHSHDFPFVHSKICPQKYNNIKINGSHIFLLGFNVIYWSGLFGSSRGFNAPYQPASPRPHSRTTEANDPRFEARYLLFPEPNLRNNSETKHETPMPTLLHHHLVLPPFLPDSRPGCDTAMGRRRHHRGHRSCWQGHATTRGCARCRWGDEKELEGSRIGRGKGNTCKERGI